MAVYNQGDKFYLSDKTRSSIMLGKKIAEGGEAYIFLVENKPDYVARMYIPEKFDKNKESKILAMVKIKFTIPHVTWPKPDELIYDSNKKLVGYLMEKIDGIEVGKFLENQKNQLSNDIQKGINPSLAKVKLRLKAASLCRDIAQKMSWLHTQDILFADINKENIMVNENDDTTFFIDTDSYQFKDYHSDASKDGFICPEILQKPEGKDYLAKNPRTKEHEYFALGTLFFLILVDSELFPFSLEDTSSLSGIDPDDISGVDGKVKLLNFILEVDKTKAEDYRGKIHPNRLGVLAVWTLMPERLRGLFVKTFAKPVVPRATPDEWAGALGEFINKLDKQIQNVQQHVQQQIIAQQTTPIPQNPPVVQAPVSPQSATPQQVVSSTNKKNNYLLYAIYVLIGITIIVVIFWDSLFASGDITKSNNMSTNQSVITSPAPPETMISPTPVPPSTAVVSTQLEQPIDNTTAISKPKKVAKPKPKSNSTTQQAPSQSSGYSSQTGDM